MGLFPNIGKDLYFKQINQHEPEFYYCTIEDLREVGVPAPPEGSVGFVSGTVTDKRIQRVIRQVSHKINQVTNQFYQPWPKDEYVNGTGGTAIYTQKLDKIIEICEIIRILSGTYAESIQSSLYVLKERFVTKTISNVCHGDMSLIDRVRLFDLAGGFRFVRGDNNWLMRGVFGDIKILPKIVVKLIKELDYEDTELHVSSTNGIKDGDYLVIENQAFLVNGVESEYILRIDPSFIKVPLTGDDIYVTRYGRVHDEIREAAMRLAIDQFIGPDSLTNVSDGTIRSYADANCDYLVSEKTDNYTYTKAKRTVRERADESLMNDGTGNPYVDSILRRYVAPLYGEFV